MSIVNTLSLESLGARYHQKTIIFAMEREAESLGLPCSVIGIGAENIRKRIKADDIVLNIVKDAR